MSRPSYVVKSNATVTITVPPEWYISISAISRKTYHQAVFIQTNIRNSSSALQSSTGTSGLMPAVVGGATTFPIAPRKSIIKLDISAFYSESNAKISPKQIRNPEYASSGLDIFEAGPPRATKPPTESPDILDSIPDYVTFFIFVEDTPDSAQVAGSGKFDDSVITVHIVKTNSNQNSSPPPPKN